MLPMFFNNSYPYTDFHELNLSWLLNRVKELEIELKNFVGINTIKYADPIQWDITTQYEANTIVIDPNTGTAYISTHPVPSGVAITNTDYWTVVFTLDINKSNENITLRNDGNNTNATFESVAGDWVIVSGVLYKVNSTIDIGDTYVPNYNILRYTVELFIADYIGELNTAIQSIITNIGDLNALTTADKTSIVNAINEIVGILSGIGDLNDLTTTDKTSIVNAINEVVSSLTTITNNIGDLTDLNTTDKSSIVNAINEVNSTGGGALALIGDLNDLQTVDKDTVVDAINEVLNDTSSAIYLNVKDYDAKGDGSTDDTLAIQHAINASASEAKSIIVFPDGDYVINGRINISRTGITLMGTGGNCSIIRTVQSNDPIFDIGVDNGVTDFEAYGFFFKSITRGGCFRISQTSCSHVHNCMISEVINFVTYGVPGSGGNIFSRVSDIIGNISVNNSIFIDIQYNSNGIHVFNCQINSEDAYTSYFVRAWPYTSVDTIEVRENLVQRITYGVSVNDADTDQIIQNIFISDNIFDSGMYHCVEAVRAVHNTFTTRFIIDNNWFNSKSQAPVMFNCLTGITSRISISNNIFVQCQDRAILTQGSYIQNIKISDNCINGFNVVAPADATLSAITIGSAIGTVTITGNDFSPSSDNTGTNVYGIYLASGCAGVILNGNNLYGVTTPLTGTPTISTGNLPASINT